MACNVESGDENSTHEMYDTPVDLSYTTTNGQESVEIDESVVEIDESVYNEVVANTPSHVPEYLR